MKKIMKRVLSVVLTVLMLLSVAPMGAFAVEDDSSVGVEGNQLNMQSSNTLGDIIIEEMENQEEQADANFGVIGVSVSGKTVTVELTNSAACRVAVALYNDDTGVMDDYILKSVAANAGEVKASFNLTAMPEFYLLRAFLIGENGEALCEAYTYIEKTHNFIEAQSKTVDDFEGEVVINFDESTDNNFAVAPENSVEINPSEGFNVLSSFDDEAGTYTFTNIDEKISKLSVGQVLCYGDDTQNILVLKVTKIEINGTTAVITADTDATMSDLFSFVKLDTESNPKGGDLTVDMTNSEEGITYEGMENYSAGEITTSAIDAGYSDSLCPTWKIDKKFGSDTGLSEATITFKAEIKLAITYSLKVYYDADWEWKLDFWNSYEDYFYFETTVESSAKLSGSVTGKLEKDIPIAELTFWTPVGITVGVGFKLCLAVSGSISIDTVKISYKFGVRFETNKGFINQSSEPKVEFLPSFKSEIELNIGIKLYPVIGFIRLFDISLGPEFGLKATGELFDIDVIDKITGAKETEKHDCKYCVDGEISYYWQVDITASVLGKEYKNFKLVAKQSVKLCDFYWSLTYGEFKMFSTCPHKSYLVTFEVKDKNGSLVKDATLNVNGETVTTGDDGTAEMYLKDGRYTVKVSGSDKSSSSEDFLVSGNPRTVKIKLKDSTGADVSSSNGSDGTGSNDSVFTGTEATGTVINFGSYPQSKVTDSTTLSKLKAVTKNWISYGYYSGTGSTTNGQMTPSDYMKYCDITLDGNKYRAVTFSKYRKYYTGYTADTSTSSTYQDDNGYYIDNVYYFKYEPLKWVVLDASTGLVVCDSAIDSQAYNNYVLYQSSDSNYYGDSTKSHYASDWEHSSLRAWLNDDFLNTAFTSTQQSKIKTVTRENKSKYDSQYDSNPTSDKITLLSYWDVLNTGYGFSSSSSTDDTARYRKSTDYAQCQGCYTSSSYNGNSRWWLRSPYISCIAANVYYDGWANDLNNVSGAYDGVVPAFNFYNLSNLQSFNPQNSTQGGEIAAEEVALTQSLPTSEAILALSGGSFTLSGAIDGNYYMVYGIKNYSDSITLTSDNLTYIDQSTAENSSVTLNYKPQSTADASVLVVGDFGSGLEVKNVFFENIFGISFENETEYVKLDQKNLLSVNFDPYNAANKSLTWQSSDPSIATVDEYGNVKGVSLGKATITATTEDGEFSAICTVEVFDYTVTTTLSQIENVLYGISPGLTSLEDYFTFSDPNIKLKYKNYEGFDRIGTNTDVFVMRGNTVLDRYTVLLIGDIDGNGWYDGQDAVILEMYLNGMFGSEKNEEVEILADCNHDGVLDEKDVELLNQAGILLSSVDQTLSTEEMLETAAYKEYSELIDQQPTDDAGTESDINAEDKADTEDKTDTTGDNTNLDLWTLLLTYLEKILSFIISLFKIA